MRRKDALSVVQKLMLGIFGRMMELNADIDRNRSDFAFAARPGRIHYIFDQNIFEMFVQPYRHTDYTPTLFNRPSRDNVAGNDDLGAQAAMICSEWLFSGELPGQRDGQLLMTEWHFDELYGLRKRVLNEKPKRKNSEDHVASFFAELERIETLSGGDPTRQYRELKERLEPALKKEFDAFEAEGWPTDVLARSLLVRECARVFAADPTSEPMQQVDRIFSKEIAPRLRPLHLAFPIDEAARASVGEDAKRWYDLLRKERESRETASSHTGSKRRVERPNASLKTDAQALAYIRWVVNRNSNSETRFVFVTGDRLLFDTYRRWYCDNEVTEIFFLRRPQQYAPVLNPRAMPSDLTKAGEVFDRIREGLELPLMVFNLQSRPEGEPFSTPQTYAAARRERFMLKLDRPDEAVWDPSVSFFVGQFGLRWWKLHETQLRTLGSHFLALQRLAIGAHFQLISRRMDKLQKMRAEYLARPEDIDSATFVANYARQLSEQIVQNSTNLFFPLALEFVHQHLKQQIAPGGAARPPIVLRLYIGNGVGDDPVDVQQLIDAFGKEMPWARRLLDVATNPELAWSQHVVFAIAACFALRLSEWPAADRWSDFALSAAEISLQARTRESAESSDGADIGAFRVELEECRYLRALSSRFWLGSISPHGTKSADNHWLAILQSGEIHLTRSERFHQNCEPRQILRELRAVSERAALRLFYASWFVVSADKPMPIFMALESGRKALLEACLDLEHCLALEGSILASDDLLDEQRGAFLRRVKQQYDVNLGAAELLWLLYDQLHREVPPLREAALLEQITVRVRQVAANSLDLLPHPVRIDLLGYLWFVCGDVEAGDRLREALDERMESGLQVDRGMTAAVHREWSRCRASVGTAVDTRGPAVPL